MLFRGMARMGSKSLARSASLPFSITLFLFAVYLFSFSGRFHVMDELAVFSAGYNLTGHGRADINQLIWTNHWTPNPPGVWGVDGNLYTKKPPGISFITASLIGLGRLLPGLNHVHAGLLTNSLVTALTAGLLFVWLADLGFSRTAATLTSLGYGLGTIAWVYARMFWESSLLALAFLVALWAVQRAIYLVQPRRRWLWLSVTGVAAAAGLSLRFEAALAIVLIGLFLITSRLIKGRSGRLVDEETASTQDSRPTGPGYQESSLVRSLIVFLAPTLLVGLGLLYFNFIRYGSPLETGYTQEISFQKPWVGAVGLLVSPGRGLFIYAPLMLLLFWGLRPAWRRLARPYLGLLGLMCLGYWLFYGSWFAWGGAWGWGPRFLLPVLPLLMLFVAGPLEWLCCQEKSGLKSRLMWLAVGILILLSLGVNLLGIVVDFNEHFSRLDSNQDFVFNWAAFPPLAHWRILQEGLVDLIWLQPQAGGLKIEWAVLLPALFLLGAATFNLIVTWWGQGRVADGISEGRGGGLSLGTGALRYAHYAIALPVAIALTWLVLAGAARIPLADRQASADLPLLETLAISSQPRDALLVAMPAFGDVQELSTFLMAYLEPPLPTYAWIEMGPRALQAAERELIYQSVQAGAARVWLFERWLTPGDATSHAAAHLDQVAFPLWERWFTNSGKLTLYALPDPSQPSPPGVPVGVRFRSGLALVDFSIWHEGLTFAPGEVVRLRLTWQSPAAADLSLPDIPAGGITVFAQLLDQGSPPQTLVQNDRLLVDMRDIGRSPLQPGQTIQQGYGLQLPDALAPGSYPLIVGLYDPTTGQRLPRADGDTADFVYLTDIVIK
ncbi:MAG: hypothetical protein Kow0063_11520 [Anaerolineae bacterium]